MSHEPSAWRTLWSGEKAIAESAVQYVKALSGIALARDFAMRTIEDVSSSGETPLTCVQIDATACKHMRSYEAIQNAFKDFDAGWQCCMHELKHAAAKREAEEDARELARQARQIKKSLRPGARATKSW